MKVAATSLDAGSELRGTQMSQPLKRPPVGWSGRVGLLKGYLRRSRILS